MNAKKNMTRIVDACLAVDLIVFLVFRFLGFFGEDEQTVATYTSISTVAMWLLIPIVLAWIVCNWAKAKETVRKMIVSLKRKPSMIPLVVLGCSFLLYSLNLTDISDTTAKIQGSGMGLSEFCIMLFSLLSMVCMLNSFPLRKKPNYPMVILMFAMFALIVYCDNHYTSMILAALNRPENPIVITEATKYIAEAYNMLNTHMVLIIVTAVLVVLMPVYAKLLRMIKTSVEVEDNGEMAQIEIED